MRRIPLSKTKKVYKFTNHFISELFEWACANPKTSDDDKLVNTISMPRLKKVAKHFPRVRTEMSNLSHLDRIVHISSTYDYYRKNYREIIRGKKRAIHFDTKHTATLHKAFSYFYKDLLDNDFFWEVYNPGVPLMKRADFRISIKSSIKICPYCDINLITDTDTNVDHFLPISKFPLLGIYWANLVVACVGCNGNLNKKDRWKLPVLHPYFDEIHESVKFRFDHSKESVGLYARKKHATVVRSRTRGMNYIWILKLDTRLGDTWPTVRKTQRDLYHRIKDSRHKIMTNRKQYISIIDYYINKEIKPDIGQTSFTKLSLDYCDDRKMNGFHDYYKWFAKEQADMEAYFASRK